MMEFQTGLEKMPLNAIFTVLSFKISQLEHSVFASGTVHNVLVYP